METIEKIIRSKNAPNSSKVLWLDSSDSTLKYQKGGGWMPLNDESEGAGNALSDIKDLKAQTESMNAKLAAIDAAATADEALTDAEIDAALAEAEIL